MPHRETAAGLALAVLNRIAPTMLVPGRIYSDRMASFNDNRATTHADVVAIFDQAVGLLDEQLARLEH
jgi:hypothetical protein